MEKYHVLGLTGEEVGGGKLSQIMNTVDQRFMESAQAVMENKIPDAKEVWVKIYIDDPMFELPESRKRESGFFVVLYCNDVAKAILTESGLSLRWQEEVDELPEKIRTYMSIPVFVR